MFTEIVKETEIYFFQFIFFCNSKQKTFIGPLSNFFIYLNNIRKEGNSSYYRIKCIKKLS